MSGFRSWGLFEHGGRTWRLEGFRACVLIADARPAAANPADVARELLADTPAVIHESRNRALENWAADLCADAGVKPAWTTDAPVRVRVAGVLVNARLLAEVLANGPIDVRVRASRADGGGACVDMCGCWTTGEPWAARLMGMYEGIERVNAPCWPEVTA